MADNKNMKNGTRRIMAFALMACILFLMLILSTGITFADDGNEGKKELSIEVVEEIPAQDIVEQEVPLAAGPVSAKSDAVRHSVLMGLLLMGTAAYAVYFNRYEKKLVLLRRQAALAEAEAMKRAKNSSRRN